MRRRNPRRRVPAPRRGRRGPGPAPSRCGGSGSTPHSAAPPSGRALGRRAGWDRPAAVPVQRTLPAARPTGRTPRCSCSVCLQGRSRARLASGTGEFRTATPVRAGVRPPRTGAGVHLTALLLLLRRLLADVRVLLLELGHPTSGVEHPLLTGVERVTHVAGLHVNHTALLGAAGDEGVPAGAGDLGYHVRRVNVRLHAAGPFLWSPGRRHHRTPDAPGSGVNRYRNCDLPVCHAPRASARPAGG